jgi:hypothetical protein
MKLPSQNHFSRSEDASSFYLTFIAHLSRGCDRLREYFEILTKQSERPLLALFRQPYRMDPKSFENTAAEGTQIFSPSSVPLMSVVKPEERGFDSIPWLKDEAQDSPRMPWKTRHFKAAVSQNFTPFNSNVTGVIQDHTVLFHPQCLCQIERIQPGSRSFQGQLFQMREVPSKKAHPRQRSTM